MNITNDELWRAADIAGLIGLSKKTIQSHYVTKQDFPRAVSTPRGRRWLREEAKKRSFRWSGGMC